MRMKNISIKISWMLAYFAVIAIICLVFFVGALLQKQVAQQDAQQTNQRNAVFIKDFLDDNWDRVFRFSLQLIYDKTMDELDQQSVDTLFSTPDAYALSKQIRDYTAFNSMVKDLYIYYPKVDYCIGNKGVYPSHTYWAALYGLSKRYSETDWLEQLFGNRARGYFTVKTQNQLDLYYRMSVPDPTGRIVVAKINTDALTPMLQWICNDEENNFVAMADVEGHIYAYAGNYERYVAQNSNCLLPVDEKSCLFTSLNSTIESLHYITITQKQAAFHLSDSLIKVSLLCMLLAFASGLLLSFIIVRRTSRSVEVIAAKLRGDQPKLKTNELQIIAQQVDALLQENKLALTALSRRQKMMARSDFLRDCLKFSGGEQRDIETLAAIYGISFENDTFLLVMREQSGMDYTAGTLALLDQIEDEQASICWVQQRDLDVFLLNYDAAPDGQPTLAREFARKLCAISSAHSRVVTDIPTTDPEQLRSAYLNCLRKLGRKEIVLENTAAGAAQFEQLQGKSAFASFQKYMADEEYLNAQNLLPTLCCNWLADADALEAACRRYLIVHQLLSQKELLQSVRLEKLAKTTDPAQFQAQLSQMLGALAKQKLLRQSMENENDIAGKIRCIIDDAYTNPLLDLRMISEQIGLSQSYVSRMFKRKYDIGISQYVNLVRVARAKDLINGGCSSIKAVAMEVGFSSDVQFIRVFKKYESITPGMFREENRIERGGEENA